MKPTLLYVDDDELNLATFEHVFRENFNIKKCKTISELLTEMDRTPHDGLLLDVHLESGKSFDSFQEIVKRSSFCGCPLFFISTDASDLNRLKSYELGALDFLPRLISKDETLSRIQSRINFFNQQRTIFYLEKLRLDVSKVKVLLHDEDVSVTLTEFKILSLLVKNYPRRVSLTDVAQNVWDKDSISEATLYTHVSNLNAKLQKWMFEISTQKVEGMGLVSRN